MTLLLQDPDWPAGPAHLDRATAVGAGVGGRRYLRLTASGPWGDSLFLKVFGSGARAQRRAKREFSAGQRLLAAGAPVVRPWALFDDEGKSVVAFTDCGAEATPTRCELLEEPKALEDIAASVAKLHAAGAFHGDLHAGNLLRGPSGEWWWTDLGRLEEKPALNLATRATDLGRWFADLDPYGARPLLRFCARYLEAAGLDTSAASHKSFARRVDDAALLRLREHHLNLDRRAKRERRGPHPGLWREPALEHARAELEALSTSGDSLKQGSRSSVVRTNLDGRPIVIKHYRPTKAADPRDRMGRSKAVASLLIAEGLRRRGLDAAMPLAAWSRSGAGSWLVLEDLPEHKPLNEVLAAASLSEQQRFLPLVAAFVRRMHRFGVYYRDLKPSNLLASLTHERPLILLDHDRNRFRRLALSPAEARRDLAALHAGIPNQVRSALRWRALRLYDPRWNSRAHWQAHVQPLLREAAERNHRWHPPGLLGSAASERVS